jgi:hypothetical protein
MTTDVIKEIIIAHPLPANCTSPELQMNLFVDSILAVSTELGKTLSRNQIEACWIRWKRERGLQEGLEPEINTATLYGAKK